MASEVIPDFGPAFVSREGGLGAVDPQSRELSMARREPEYELMTAAKAALEEGTDTAVMNLKPIAAMYVSEFTDAKGRLSRNLASFDGILDAIAYGSIDKLRDSQEMIERYAVRYNYGMNPNVVDMNKLIQDDEVEALVAKSEGISLKELKRRREEEEREKKVIKRKDTAKAKETTQKIEVNNMATKKRKPVKAAPARRPVNTPIEQAPAKKKTVGEASKPVQTQMNREQRRKLRSFAAEVPVLTKEEKNDAQTKLALQHLTNASNSLSAAAEAMAAIDLNTVEDGIEAVMDWSENLQMLEQIDNALEALGGNLMQPDGVDVEDDDVEDDDTDFDDSDDDGDGEEDEDDDEE